MRYIHLNIIIAGIFVLLGGAGEAQTPAPAPAYVDAAQRSVVLPKAVKKVLAAGPPAAVILYTLAPDKLSGWIRPLDADSLAYLPERYRSLPVTGRVTGRDSVDAAAIKKLAPDLIVDFGTVNPSYAATAGRTQAATSIPYVLIDGALQASPAAYRSLGAIVQAPARGEMLAARSQALLDEVKNKLSGLPASSRKRVYVARGPDGNDSYGTGVFTTEVLAPAGGVNVAEGWGAGNLSAITPEKVRDANPDIVIALDPYFRDVTSKTAAWQQVPAIAAGRIHVAPRQPFGWLDEPPSVNRLIGLRWLAGVLYPDRFGDLRPAVRDFFRTFYQAEPSGPQLDKLVSGKP